MPGLTIQARRNEGSSGLYWARQTEGDDHEIRVVVGGGETYSYPAGVSSREPFEGLHEKVDA